MKKILLFTFLLIFVVSCQERTGKHEENTSSLLLKAKETIKADINFESNPIADRYRTVISEQYNELDINFAYHYIIITWGCGSGCVSGAMVDTRDGIVYSLPKDKDWGGNGTYIDSKKESNTLTTVLVAQSPTGEIEETRKYWEWKEDVRKFNFVKVDTVLVKNNE